MFRAAALSLFLAAPAAFASPPPPALPQPTQIPGNWEWSPRPLPPLEQIVAAPNPDRPVYGLYCWENEYRKFHDTIRQIGWLNFRLSGPITDDVMRLYARDGAEVMFTMAARRPFPTETHPMGEWRNRKNFPTDEAFIADYLGDVTKVLERYGPGGEFWKQNPDLPANPLRYLEIFNEPNFWYLDTAREDTVNHFPPKDPEARKAQDASRQQLYAKLLAAAYPHIKSRWPEVRVVAFAAGAGSVGADIPFIRAVHAAAADIGRHYDILSTHPYIRPAPPEGATVRSFGKFSIIGGHEQIRATMAAAGNAAKPVWWTELNWTIFPETGGAYAPAQFDGRSLQRDTTPELQAAYLARGYALALRLGVSRVHYMALVDTDGANSGSLNADGSWRPSAHAVKTMIGLLPRPKLLGALRDGEEAVFAYRLDPDYAKAGDGEVIMAYAVKGPTEIDIPWPSAEAECIDMVGNRSPKSPEGGSLRVAIGPLPVYLRAPAK